MVKTDNKHTVIVSTQDAVASPSSDKELAACMQETIRKTGGKLSNNHAQLAYQSPNHFRCRKAGEEAADYEKNRLIVQF
jgi:hypothetical protein